MRHFILDENHVVQPCDDLMAFARWFEKADRHVARTQIGDALVSTVFLGFDHRYGDGPPILFETMIFSSPLAGYQKRCCTWAEAEQQHEEACRLLRAELSLTSSS
jgi:hypothetical protein